VASKNDATKEVTLDVWEEIERDGKTVTPIKNSQAVVSLA
jgi:hypothetical protein